MITRHTAFACISVLELVAGAAGLVLFAASVSAFSQTPPPRAAVGLDGKPVVEVKPARVLADPATKMYSVCTTDGEHKAVDGDSDYKPNPAAQLMTEEAAKAKGFKAGAHKVTCK
jgi:hypothetical protein